jgi:hypothetical protein
MTKHNSVVAIFKSHVEAETAVKELQQAGFDMKKLSIVGHAREIISRTNPEAMQEHQAGSTKEAVAVAA